MKVLLGVTCVVDETSWYIECSYETWLYEEYIKPYIQKARVLEVIGDMKRPVSKSLYQWNQYKIKSVIKI